MEKQEIIISDDIRTSLPEAMAKCPHDRLFVLTDENTLRLCWPVVSALPCLREAQLVTIGATDEHKTLDSLSQVWTALQRGGATRHSLMVNLGGGMVTDLGGFAASTFKRGIAYINIPDVASHGGRLGGREDGHQLWWPEE